MYFVSKLPEYLEGHLFAAGKRHSYIRARVRRREASVIVTCNELFVVVSEVA
jgi:hypothetical protein